MAVRVGIVGLGFMGKQHLDIYLANPKAQVVAFADVDEKKRAGDWSSIGGNIEGKGGAAAFDPKSLKAFASLDEMLAAGCVDLVDITLPTYLHVEAAVKALQAGVHVLCEKPLAVSSKEADKVVKAAAKAKGRFMTAMCMRFWPGWTWLKEAVEKKTYGRLCAAVFKRFGSTPRWSWQNWLLTPKLSGSALLDLHIHDTDFVQFLLGRPKAVFSVGTGGKATKGGIDHVVTQYIYGRNLVVSAEGGWHADPGYGFTMRYTAVFEKATADFDLGREKKLAVHLADGRTEYPQLADTTGWAQEIDYFLDCIAGGKPVTTVTPKDARQAVAICEAELKSIQTGKVVAVK
jgi:predicted dehydrogenase